MQLGPCPEGYLWCESITELQSAVDTKPERFATRIPGRQFGHLRTRRKRIAGGFIHLEPRHARLEGHLPRQCLIAAPPINRQAEVNKALGTEVAAVAVGEFGQVALESHGGNCNSGFEARVPGTVQLPPKSEVCCK